MDPMNNDPLGIGLKMRAQEHRRQFDETGRTNALNHGQMVGFGHLGPLQDPMWEGLFQAMDEQGVDKTAGGDSNGYSGLPESTAGIYKPTYGTGQQSAAQPMPYTQSAAQRGLQAAGTPFQNPRGSHNDFMANNPAAQDMQRLRGVK